MEQVPHAVEEALRRVLARVAGPAAAEAPIALLGRRADYHVLEATPSRAPALIVKMAGPSSDAPSFGPASAGHWLAARLTRLNLPRILAWDDGMSFVPFRYLVRERAEGLTWASLRPALEAPERDEALRQLGAAVAELHAARLPGFGALAEDGSVPVPLPVVDALARHARGIIRNPALARDFERALRAASDAFEAPGPPTICHDDLHGLNLLFEPGPPCRFSTILDFDKAWAGPAESDIARMELWRGMTGPGFWRAYRARHPEREGYADRRPFYQLLWCLEYAESSEEHLATTNDLLRVVGLPPIRGFIE